MAEVGIEYCLFFIIEHGRKETYREEEEEEEEEQEESEREREKGILAMHWGILFA